MKNNISKTYAITAIIAIAIFSMLLLVPTNAFAAKQTTSGVHFQPQGARPTVQLSGNTATSTPFTLAGLGQGTGTATLTVTGFFDVTCSNPGQNEDVPGQRTSATGTSGDFGFTANGGKADIRGLSATLDPDTVTFGPKTCPNQKWTPSVVGSGTVTSATLIVRFNGQTILTCTPTGCSGVA